MFSSTLMPANKFPPHYASQTFRRSGAPPYMKTCLDTNVEINTFESTRAREFVVDLETDTELRGTIRYQPRSAQQGLYGAESVPLPASLNRQVLKWLQSLDLSHSIRNIRRDAANGFLVAEICSRYYPNDIKMHSYQSCTNTEMKVDNWRQLKEFFREKGLKIQNPVIEGTIKGLHGSAVELMEHMYELFTGKKVQQMPIIDIEETEEGTGKFNDRRRGHKPVDPASVVPGLTPGSKMLTKNMPTPPPVQFGAVRLTNMESMSAARAKMGIGSTR